MEGQPVAGDPDNFVDLKMRIQQSLPLLKGFSAIDIDGGYDLAPNLPDGNVTLMLRCQPVIIKLPIRGARSEAAVVKESTIVADVLEAGPPPYGLETPELIDAHNRHPYHLVIRRLGGTVLSNDAVRSFSPTEKRAYGHRVGAFVAWMAQTIHPDVLTRIEEIHYSYEDELGEDVRIKSLFRYWGDAMEGEVPDVLTDVLLWTKDEYTELKHNGQLASTVVGHNDLRPDNMTFERGADGWQLRGIFDFDSVSRSSPARELRHMLILDEEISNAAAEACSDRGYAISDRELTFWAICQAVTAGAAFHRLGNREGVRECVQPLARLRMSMNLARATNKQLVEAASTGVLS